MIQGKRISLLAVFCVGMMATAGCAGIQTTHLTPVPDFLAVRHSVGVANTAARRTLRDSRSLMRQTARAANSDPAVAALRPQVKTVARDAQQTNAATSATLAIFKPALKVQAAFVQSARAVQAGELHNAARYHAITHSLSYKLGRFIVLTVFLLLVAGGLILFSESGWAGVIAMKFPILAAALFKPLEYLGSLLGKVWGYIETGVATLWRVLARNFPWAAKTSS